MTEQNSIFINLDELTLGQHQFDYQLDNAFFEGLEQDEVIGGNCHAQVSIVAREASFSLGLHIEGQVAVTCDRCLDPMQIELDEIEDNFLVKLAREDGEDDEAIYVNQEQPMLNIGWLLYEEIAVSLPVVHSHQPGECNPEMESLLQAHLCTDLADETEEEA